MIKFFRHIRKSLLMENKTGKYFKYAIGEIVLVVIGILIALSINNWNETRKQNNQTNSFLLEIAKDIKQDIVILKVHKSRRDSVLKWNQKVRNNYALDINNLHDFKKAERFFYEYYFTPNTKGIESLKNSGLITQINNQQIDSLLQSYYAQVEHIKNKEISYNTVIENVEFKFKTELPVDKYMFLLNAKTVDENLGTNFKKRENELFEYYNSNIFKVGVIRSAREGTNSYKRLIDIGESYINEVKHLNDD